MMSVLLWILGVLVFILVLMVSIGLHEAGHMVAAKAFGLSVPRYFIGLGPTLWSFKRRGTEYGMKLIPLGGFVNIEDPSRPEGEDDRALLSYVHPLKRIVVFAAAPLVNLVLGVAILMVAITGQSYTSPTTTVESVVKCEYASHDSPNPIKPCGASRGRLWKGDKILAINGHPTKTMGEVKQTLSTVKDHKTATVSVLRTYEDKSQLKIDFDVIVEKGTIGVNMTTVERKLSAMDSAKILTAVSVEQVKAIPELAKQIPAVYRNIIGQGNKDEKTATSIIAVGKTYGDIAADKSTIASGSSWVKGRVHTLVLLSGLINLSLFVMNALIPLLPLDSGRIVIALVDLVRMGWSKASKATSKAANRITRGNGWGGWHYRPLSSKAVATLTFITAFPLLTFFLMLIVSDIVSIVRGTI